MTNNAVFKLNWARLEKDFVKFILNFYHGGLVRFDGFKENLKAGAFDCKRNQQALFKKGNRVLYKF